VDSESDPRVERIDLLKVPIDILPEEKLEEVVKGMLDDGRIHQIVLLSLWDLMRCRRNPEYRAMIGQASLVIPISLTIIKGAKFLKRPVPVRYMPFDFLIKLFNVLERWNKTAYILGSKKKHIQIAERNLKATFPGMRIVGRYAGYYGKSFEGDIVEAVKKATPSLLLVGRGVPGREKWIPRNIKSFKSGLFLWCSDAFDVFAEKRGRASRSTFQKGLEWIPYTLRNPWKIFRCFIFLYYKILLLVYRLRKR
jgi:N-acetylglucosaminyldiphosphoundecaprenol N-acetyl-beta-D-mannosaminyltransferase